MRIFSNLNLGGKAPLRAQPKVGEWGPERVITTRAKKWQRVLVPVVSVLLAVGLFFLGRMFYLTLTGAMALS